ncbi:MAG: hypothetical protein ABIJ41_06300 [Candidatus Omnitrophota bacterium]
MCYTVPAAGAIVTTVMWSRTKDVKLWWLNLLFWGGALFGLIDHWWNGELFFVGEHIVSDLLLGVTITLAIFIFWKIMMAKSKTHPTLANYINIKNS